MAHTFIAKRLYSSNMALSRPMLAMRSAVVARNDAWTQLKKPEMSGELGATFFSTLLE